MPKSLIIQTDLKPRPSQTRGLQECITIVMATTALAVRWTSNSILAPTGATKMETWPSTLRLPGASERDNMCFVMHGLRTHHLSHIVFCSEDFVFIVLSLFSSFSLAFSSSSINSRCIPFRSRFKPFVLLYIVDSRGVPK
jgi:hypothetical protein